MTEHKAGEHTPRKKKRPHRLSMQPFLLCFACRTQRGDASGLDRNSTLFAGFGFYSHQWQFLQMGYCSVAQTVQSTVRTNLHTETACRTSPWRDIDHSCAAFFCLDLDCLLRTDSFTDAAAEAGCVVGRQGYGVGRQGVGVFTGILCLLDPFAIL